MRPDILASDIVKKSVFSTITFDAVSRVGDTNIFFNTQYNSLICCNVFDYVVVFIYYTIKYRQVWDREKCN